jgi:hypothetical protein
VYALPDAIGDILQWKGDGKMAQKGQAGQTPGSCWNRRGLKKRTIALSLLNNIHRYAISQKNNSACHAGVILIVYDSARRGGIQNDQIHSSYFRPFAHQIPAAQEQPKGRPRNRSRDPSNQGRTLG